MLKTLFKSVTASAFMLIAFSTAVMAETFVFTAIPDQDETKLKARFTKIASYLSKELGVDVKYIPVKSYSAAVTAFRNNQVQLAWFGGLSGVRARHLVKDSQAIAQGFEDPNFQTYFIAHVSTGLKKSSNLPTEIAGKTFTFGSKGSTSGRLMPEYHIRRVFSKAPDQVFSRVGYSGNHSKTIALVQSGAFQVGATNYKVWKRELAAGNIDASKVQVIWETPGYPDYNWSIRGDVNAKFGAGFTDKVQNALINMKDPDLLAAFPRKSFIKATNKDFQPVLDLGKKVGLIE
jgi:phosphonate transport system substrate-binding protein